MRQLLGLRCRRCWLRRLLASRAIMDQAVTKPGGTQRRGDGDRVRRLPPRQQASTGYRTVTLRATAAAISRSRRGSTAARSTSWSTPAPR